MIKIIEEKQSIAEKKSSKAGQQSSSGGAQSKRSKKNGTKEKCLKADPLIVSAL